MCSQEMLGTDGMIEAEERAISLHTAVKSALLFQNGCACSPKISGAKRTFQDRMKADSVDAKCLH